MVLFPYKRWYANEERRVSAPWPVTPGHGGRGARSGTQSGGRDARRPANRTSCASGDPRQPFGQSRQLSAGLPNALLPAHDRLKGGVHHSWAAAPPAESWIWVWSLAIVPGPAQEEPQHPWPGRSPHAQTRRAVWEINSRDSDGSRDSSTRRLNARLYR